MHEEFKLACDGLADASDLVKREFPLKNEARKAQTFQKCRLLGRPDGALGRCMKRDPDIFLKISDAVPCHLDDGQILHDQGIRPGFLHIQHLPVCGFQFFVI